MRTDIKLTSIDTQAKKNTLSITHANPEASNYAMRTLAQKINALTTNTYSGATRVDTTDLANAQPVTPKQDASITLNASSATNATMVSQLNKSGASYWATQFSTTSDAVPYIVPVGSVFQKGLVVGLYYGNTGNGEIVFTAANAAFSGFSESQVFKIRVDETDNYHAAEATFTITV